MTPTEAAVLAAIREAAREGRVCPTNAELVTLLDLKSSSTPSKAMQTLERDGLIIVQRFTNSRIVTFPGAGGLATADPFTAAPAIAGTRQTEHARLGRGGAHGGDGTARHSPCSFCGTNPAYGCDCRPRAQTLTVLRGRLPQEIAA